MLRFHAGEPAAPGEATGAPGRGRRGSPSRLGGSPPAWLSSTVLGWTAVAGISAATVLMLAVSLAGPSKAVVWPRAAGGWPPWELSLHLSVPLVTVTIWAAAVIGAAGVTAGLLAVRRGSRPAARWLVIGSLVATGAFAVLPVAGSTDALDYAAYGRMAAQGYSPYVTTPHLMIIQRQDPVAKATAHTWRHAHSVYGPLATAEQAAAAELGGTSAARITFWLKLWNALAFASVVVGLDMLLRRDSARRLRAHLLWSVNPLVLWGLVASGHVDALAAAFGFFAVAVLKAPDGGRPVGVRLALAAGGLAGAAADIKAVYAVFGLGIAWALRKSPRALAAALGGALLVLLPSYLWFGRPALAALAARVAKGNHATSDNLYALLARPFGLHVLPLLVPVAVTVLVSVAVLLLWRLPDGFPSRPAARPALALGLAWLLAWPYQRAWYDAMALCLLALYPATGLDWPVLGRLFAGTLYAMPGMPGRYHVYVLGGFAHFETVLFMPAVRLAALIAIVVLCLRPAHAAFSGHSANAQAAGGQ